MSKLGFIPIGEVKPKYRGWWVQPIIPKKGFTFISGEPKAGKSYLALHLALSLTKNDKFLHEFKTERAKVLYYSLEDSKGIIALRAKHLLGKKRLPDNFFIFDQKTGFRLPHDLENVRENIKEYNAKIIFIDTFRRSTDIDENSSQEVSRVVNGLRGLVQQEGISVIVIHHTGRGITNVNDAGSWLRGSSDLEAAYDALIGIRKNRKTMAVDAFLFHKFRSNTTFSYEIIRGESKDQVLDDYPITDFVYLDEKQTKEKPQPIKASLSQKIEICDTLQKKGAITKPQISEATNIQGQTLNRRLDELIKHPQKIVLISDKMGGKRGTAELFILNRKDYKTLLTAK